MGFSFSSAYAHHYAREVLSFEGWNHGAADHTTLGGTGRLEPGAWMF